MTRYYDEAPLDEYGQIPGTLIPDLSVLLVSLSKLILKSFFLLLYDDSGLQKEPKWGHLKDLHNALKLCRKGLLWGTPSVQKFDAGFEVSRVTFIKLIQHLDPIHL